VRPASFVEINNFYTATVYEKGAELIGMLKRLVGETAYAKAVALYFDRHDGQACTIEDWLKAFEDVTGRDLSQFKRWYEEAGTPRLKVEETWEAPEDGAGSGSYTLTFTQSTPPTPGQPLKEPAVIPVLLAAYDETGAEILPEQLVLLDQPELELTYDLAARRPPARSPRSCVASPRPCGSRRRSRPRTGWSCSPMTATRSTAGRRAAA
jgi:aminopeptidase N